MGQGGLLKPLLWSEFMYPIARINNTGLISASPLPRPLAGGMMGNEPTASHTMLSFANHHPLSNIFIVKNLSDYSIMEGPSVYFPLCRQIPHILIACILLSSLAIKWHLASLLLSLISFYLSCTLGQQRWGWSRSYKPRHFYHCYFRAMVKNDVVYRTLIEGQFLPNLSHAHILNFLNDILHPQTNVLLL